MAGVITVDHKSVWRNREKPYDEVPMNADWVFFVTNPPSTLADPANQRKFVALYGWVPLFKGLQGKLPENVDKVFVENPITSAVEQPVAGTLPPPGAPDWGLTALASLASIGKDVDGVLQLLLEVGNDLKKIKTVMGLD